MQSMELKKLLSYTRQAVDDYKLIKEGDHIAVGISGGKDSLTLLYALAGLRRFYPKKFTLTAITVDLGYDSFDLTPIKQLCEELKVPYGTLYGWVQAAKNGDLDIEERTPENAMSLAEEIRQLRSEVKRLNKENKRLQEERDFLNEAAAFFAASRRK